MRAPPKTGLPSLLLVTGLDRGLMAPWLSLDLACDAPKSDLDLEP